MQMRSLMLLATIVPLALASAADAKKATSMGRTRGAPPALSITTNLLGPGDEQIGTATVTQEAGGVHVAATLSGLPAGSYAIHLHAVGKCEGPAFTTAGGHFNPGMKQHGNLNPMGEHAGDLPNLTIGADGKGSLDAMRSGMRLVDGDAPLLDGDGAAIVLHAGPDDYKTDPSGNSGARIACGVLVAARK